MKLENPKPFLISRIFQSATQLFHKNVTGVTLKPRGQPHM